MKRKLALLITIISASFIISKTKAQQTSFNLQDLDFVAKEIEDNYSAYEEKYNAEYDKLLAKVRKNISSSTDSIYNFHQLSLLSLFFKDIHIQLSSVNPVLFDSIFCINKLKEIQDKNNPANSIEGYWKSDHDDIVIYVQKTNAHKDYLYEAVVAETANKNVKSGSIKFYITKDKMDKYFVAQYIGSRGNMVGLHSYLQSKDTLITGLYYKWTKIKNYNPEYLKKFTPLVDSTFAKVIDSNHFYIKVYRSDYPTKHIVDSLVEVYRPIISKTPNLIIDIRNNTGGSWAVYKSLFPYIFTKNPLEGASSVRCSEDIINDGKERIKRFEKDTSLTWLLPGAIKELDSMQKYRGGYYYAPPDTVKADTLPYYPSAYPKKVVVLMNYKCVSASEMFIKFCQQSKKAIVAGETTWGALDNVEFLTYNNPSKNIRLLIPRVRMYYYDKNAPTIDYKGVKPDITIPSTEPDWIKYMMDYIKNNK